jgi:hypothetical protein
VSVEGGWGGGRVGCVLLVRLHINFSFLFQFALAGEN